MTSRKEARQLAKKAKEQGWIVDYSNGGHLRYKSPDGKTLFFSSTPSDTRALKNQISVMSKHGFIRQ
jgi:predicted RNA binding protein YcfA (HicA-like mRNA interferase family)